MIVPFVKHFFIFGSLVVAVSLIVSVPFIFATILTSALAGSHLPDILWSALGAYIIFWTWVILNSVTAKIWEVLVKDVAIKIKDAVTISVASVVSMVLFYLMFNDWVDAFVANSIGIVAFLLLWPYVNSRIDSTLKNPHESR